MRIGGLKSHSSVARFVERHAIWLAILCGSVLFAIGLTITHKHRNYNSDDTAQQVIVDIWNRGLGQNAFVPLDNYVAKMPFYAFLNAVVDNPESALLIATLVFNVVGFILFGLSVRYFWTHYARNSSASPWLAIVWLAVLANGFYDIIINPNTRNVELGFAFLLLAVFAHYLSNGFNFGPTTYLIFLGVGILFHGLFIYHTAYYLVFMLVPLGALLLLSLIAFEYRPRYLRLLIFLGVSVGASIAWRLLFHAFGWLIVGESAEFTTAGDIGFHFEVLLEGLLIVFGANLLGRDIFSTEVVRPLAQIALLLPVLAYPIYVIRTYRLTDHLWRFYFSLLPYFVALVFVSTNYVIDIESKRYLVLLPFAAAITVGFLYSELKQTHLQVLLTFILGVNVLFGVISVATLNTSGQTPNSENLATIGQVQSLGLDKGYANFWQANINSYLSNGEADFIQVVCVEGRLRPYRFLTDEGILHKPAEQSFYLYDDRRSDMDGCDIWSLESQLGPPTSIVQINDHISLAIYNYDIAVVFDD